MPWSSQDWKINLKINKKAIKISKSKEGRHILCTSSDSRIGSKTDNWTIIHVVVNPSMKTMCTSNYLILPRETIERIQKKPRGHSK